jgi:hypothetical protein
MSLAAALIGFILASFSIAATNGGIGSFPEAVVIAFLIFNLPEDPSQRIRVDYVGIPNPNNHNFWRNLLTLFTYI